MDETGNRRTIPETGNKGTERRMNRASGFVVLHRRILGWEWYKNTNTTMLFIHLLLKANFAEGRFEGRGIARGQLVTSLSSLAEETGLTFQQVRTALAHLLSTGEITSKRFRHGRIITVRNYAQYQDRADPDTEKPAVTAAESCRGKKRNPAKNQQADNRLVSFPDKAPGRQESGDQQAVNRQITGSQQQYNNKNNKNKGTKRYVMGFTAPTPEEVASYVREIGSAIDPGYFFDYYEANGWTLRSGQKMKDWKATVRNWERREKNGEYRGNRGKAHGEVRQDYSSLRDTVINL